MNPPDLRYIVKTSILKYLICSSDISRDHLVMLEYFRGWGQGVFGDEILTQIIEDFPSQLTDELLVILSPPHLKQLKLTNCTRLSCNGLQKALAKYVCSSVLYLLEACLLSGSSTVTKQLQRLQQEITLQVHWQHVAFNPFIMGLKKILHCYWL